MLSWLLFRKYLLSRRAGALVKRISWLCIFGVSLSLAAFLIVLCVMAGLNQTIHERLLSVEPHMVVQFSTPPNKDIGETIKSNLEKNGAKGFEFETQDVILRTQEGLFRGATARGVTEESLGHLLETLKTIHSTSKKQDDYEQSTSAAWFHQLNENASAPDSQEVILGSELARMLGVFEGDTLSVIAPESLLLPPSETPKIERLRVTRIITTDVAEIDGQVLFYIRGKSLRRLSSQLSFRQGYEIWTTTPYTLDPIRDIFRAFPEMTIESWQERNSALFYALRLEKTIMGTFLGLSALITGFSILSVLTLLISQKTADIQILKAMGLSQSALRKTFIQIGMYLSCLGLGIGFALGLSASLYIEKYPLNVLPDIYYDSQIPAQVNLGFVLLTLACGVVLSLFGSYWPTRKAIGSQRLGWKFK